MPSNDKCFEKKKLEKIVKERKATLVRFQRRLVRVITSPYCHEVYAESAHDITCEIEHNVT